MSSVVGLELPNAWRTAKPNDNVNFDISADQLNITTNREMWIPGATINWAGTRMINAGTPTAATDLTTKTYVDIWTVDRDAAGFDLLNVGGIQINNPLDTFQYIVTPSAIIADRIVTLPILTGPDTFVFEAFAQTLTNKTITSAANTLTIDAADVTTGVLAKAQLPATTVYTDQANTFGAFDQRFPTTRLQLDNPAQTFQYIFATSAIITADKTITLPLLTTNDTFVFEAFTQTLTNKTLDANNNTVSNIGDSEITTHTSTKISIIAKPQLNSNIVYTDQANVFGDFAQTVADNQFFIQNPASTFEYQFIASSIVADTTVTLPLLTGNDIFVFESFTQTLANKTLTTPTIASFVNAVHDHQAAAGGGTLLSTAVLSDTANIAYLNTANIYGAGLRQDFLGSTAGTAGLNAGGIAGNPTTQVNGDIWLNTSTNQLFGRVNGVDVDLGGAGVSLPVVDTTSIAEGSIDPTKEVRFELDGNNTGIIGVLATTFTTAKTITFPDATDTVVVLALSQTLTNKTINLLNNTVTGTRTQFDTAVSDGTIAFIEQTNTWGDFDQRFLDNRLLIQNPATTADYTITAGAITGNRILNLPVVTATDTFVTEAFAQTLTNKTMTAAANTFSGFVIGTEVTGASTALSDTADIAYLNQANAFGAFDTSFLTSRFQLRNPAATFDYIFATSALAGDITVTLPLLTGADTFVFEAFAATLTNKTVNLTSNTLTGTTAQFNTALSDNDFATLAGSEILINKAITYNGREEIDKGADIASADAVIFGTDGNVFDITGVVTVNHFTNTNWQIGSIVTIHWDGILTVTHNAGGLLGDETNISLIGNTNFTTAAGDISTFMLHDATTWEEVARNAAGGGSQTPWTSTIDAADFSLTNLDILDFNVNTDATTSAAAQIYWDNVVMALNVPTGDSIALRINGANEYNFGNTQLNMNDNDLSFLTTHEIRWGGSTNRAIFNDVSGFEFRVETGDNFDWQIQGVSQMTFNGTTLDITAANIANAGTLNTHTIPGGTSTFMTIGATQTVSAKTLDNTNQFNGFVDFAEIAAPGAPAANEARLYAADVGGNTHIFQDNSTESPIDLTTGSGGEFTGAWTADHNQGGSTFALQDALFADPTDSTKRMQIDLAGMTTAITAILDFNFTTAKTLTFPDATDTVIARATTDTLTNKSIALSGNTVTGTAAEFDTAVTDDNFVFDGATNVMTGAIQITAGTMRVPVSATPTIAVNGDFAIDTTITDFTTPLIRYFGTESMVVVAVPTAQTVTPTGGDVVSYNATNDEFELVAPGAASLPVPDTTSIAEGSVDATKEVRFEVDGNTTGIIGVIATVFTTAKTVTLPDAVDTLMGKATTDVMTNKSYDLGGAGNVLTGSVAEFNTALQAETFAYIGQTNVFTAGVKSTHTHNGTTAGLNIGPAAGDPSGLVNGDIWLSTSTNTHRARIAGATRAFVYETANQTITNKTFTTGNEWADDALVIQNPANTFNYIFQAAAITIANRTITLPLLTGNDTMVTEAFPQTLTNKTIDSSLNTITNIVNADINATAAIVETKFSVAVGAATTVLTSNGVGVAPTYQTPSGGEFTGAWTANHNNGGSTFALEDALFADPTDDTKQMQIDLAGMTTAITLTLDVNQTTNQTLTVPNITAADNLVTDNTTATLANKTLTTPTIASFTNATHTHANAAGGGQLTNTALVTGVFSAITGLGAQTQDLDMSGQDIDNVANIITSNIFSPFWRFQQTVAQADGYTIGILEAEHPDGLSIQQTYAEIDFVMENDDNGTENGSMHFFVTEAGVHGAEYMDFNNAGNAIIEIFRNADLNQNSLLWNTDGHSIVPSATALTFDLGAATDDYIFQTNAVTRLTVSDTIVNAASGTTFQENGVDISPIGAHDIPISATSMWVTTNTPATGPTLTNLATNDIDINTMQFTSTAVDETVQFEIPFPRNYNNSTIVIQYNWSFASGTGDVVWRTGAVAVGDNEAIDAAFTFHTDLVDIAGTANQIQQATSASFTPAGTPADANVIHFEVMRQGSDAADTFTGTARLHSIVVRITTDAAVAA